MKADKVAEQAGQLVESIVKANLRALDGKSGSKRGVLRPLFGLIVLAGGAGAIYYSQADEQQREQASGKVSELVEQLRGQVEALTG